MEQRKAYYTQERSISLTASAFRYNPVNNKRNNREPVNIFGPVNTNKKLDNASYI